MAFTGNEVGTPVGVPAGQIFDFNAAIIRELLARDGALGVRFHFDGVRPNPLNDLYACACGPVNDIHNASVLGRDYFSGLGREVDFPDLPDTVKANFGSGEKVGACVFVSRKMLEEDILSNPNVNAIRLFVAEFGQDDSRGVPTFTLAVSGLVNGNMSGPLLQSEEPCPPVCGDDYPPGLNLNG